MMTLIIFMVVLFAIAVLGLGLGLFCVLWDEYKDHTPTWMFRYLDFLLPFSGWDEAENEDEED